MRFHNGYMRGPESFVSGGPNLISFFLFDEGIENSNIPKNGPEKRHLKMAFRWRVNGSFVIFQGIRTSIAKKPLNFCDFSGGGGVRTPCPPLDPHMG